MSDHRAVRAVAAVALGLALAAGATSAPAAATAPAATAFQVPMVYLSNCFFLLMCTLPFPVSVTPTVTPAPAAGTVTFDVQQQSLLDDCADTWIHWRNLATGAAGEARLAVGYNDSGVGPPCLRMATVVTTGSGPVVATVTAPPGGDPPLTVVNPGFGAFLVR